MDIIIFFLIVGWIIKKVKNDQRASDIGKAIGFVIFGLFLIGIFSSFLPILFPIAAIALIVKLIKRYENKQFDIRKEKYGWDDELVKDIKSNKHTVDKEFQNAASLKSKILPKAINKRKKLIREFSDKYQLNLTEEQVKCIADASYMSLSWKLEVEQMMTKYDAISQWFTGNTAYLRAYLHVFPVQDVSSDFKQQFQICIDTFEEVFRYSDSLVHLSRLERIEKINSKFLTNFDDVTYMIAYRFLERLGFQHQLDKVDLNTNDNDIDELLKKYQAADADDHIV